MLSRVRRFLPRTLQRSDASGLNPIRLSIALMVAFFSWEVQAEPMLLSNSYLFDCPFYRLDNTFDMSGVQAAVKQIIENKLKVREACRAPLNQLQSSINATEIFLGQLSPEKERTIVSEIFGNFREDLSARLLYLETRGLGTGSEALALKNTLERSYEIQLQGQLSSSLQRATSTENLLRTQLYQNFQSMVQSLRSLHSSRCLDVVGRPRDLVVPALKMAALATGFSGLAAKTLTTTVLDLASNLSFLLIDRKIRRAQWENDRVTNDQIIACTYYALKYSACEFKAAQGLAKDADRIRDILSLRVAHPQHPEFDRLLDFRGRLPVYRELFDRFLSEGTALSLNPEVVIGYYVALITRPFEIRVPKVKPDQSEFERPNFDISSPTGLKEANLWLTEVRQRGVEFQTSNFSGVLSIGQQLEQAVTDILNKRNRIRTTGELLKSNLAFRDVRDRLNAYRNIRAILQTDLKLLIDFISGSESSRVLGPDQSALYSAYVLLKELYEFVSLDVSQIDVKNIQEKIPQELRGQEECTSAQQDASASGGRESDPIAQRLACFHYELNLRGLAVYARMARGAIAQASSQTVLIIPEKVINRIELAIVAIEQALLREDLNQRRPREQSYAVYRDQARMRQVIFNNIQAYGVDNAFDETIYQKAFLSMELAFAPEILRMLDRASENDRNLFNESVPEPQRTPHQIDRLAQLCSLFASSLPNISGGQAWLDYCKVNAPTLEQYRAISPTPVKIEYGDACVYPQHQRLLKIQRLTLEQIR